MTGKPTDGKSRGGKSRDGKEGRMNRICVIFDKDEKYGKRLMNVINEKKSISYRVHLFTEKRDFIEYM